MKEHPHAEVLRAIADGVPLSEFEAKSTVNVDEWGPLWSRMYWSVYPNEYEIRRKPQHIMVNGFKVPKPLDRVANCDAYYTPNTDWEPPYGEKHAMTEMTTEMHISRGIAHATKEAAIAHAKAMLGIDPEYFK